jgi:hypothetical protein
MWNWLVSSLMRLKRSGEGQKMADTTALPVEERLLHLLQELGIAQVHIVARDAADWQGFVGTYPDRVASLSLLYPGRVFLGVGSGEALNEQAATGTWPKWPERWERLVEAIEGARSVTLRDYEAPRGRISPQIAPTILVRRCSTSCGG